MRQVKGLAKPTPTYEQLQSALIDYLPGLFRVARGYGLGESDAEDLVHDTCVRALQRYQTSPPRETSAIRAWLHQILLNLFRDQYRRALRSPVMAAGIADNVVELMPSLAPSQEDEAFDSRFADAADRALRTLPEDSRTVLVLVLVEEFSYAEVADIAKCAIGTVASRVARGRSALREALQDFEAPNRGTHGLSDNGRCGNDDMS